MTLSKIASPATPSSPLRASRPEAPPTPAERRLEVAPVGPRASLPVGPRATLAPMHLHLRPGGPALALAQGWRDLRRALRLDRGAKLEAGDAPRPLKIETRP